MGCCKIHHVIEVQGRQGRDDEYLGTIKFELLSHGPKWLSKVLKNFLFFSFNPRSFPDMIQLDRNSSFSNWAETTKGTSLQTRNPNTPVTVRPLFAIFVDAVVEAPPVDQGWEGEGCLFHRGKVATKIRGLLPLHLLHFLRCQS